jgi:hypothetical protein
MIYKYLDGNFIRRMKKINFNSKACINISTESYSGKESSPKGLGYSAVTYPIGQEMIGVDKQIWSVQMKNGKKVWFRKSGMPILTHEEPIITNSNEESVIVPQQQTTVEIKTEEIPQQVIEEVIEKKTVKTDYSIFYTYYSNKLKSENMEKGIKKEPKDIRDETIEEWNKLKKNKKELQELLNIIKNKR